MRRHYSKSVQGGWHKHQIAVVHIYASMARLTDAEYRQLLRDHTFLGRYHQGAITSKDLRLTQLDFDTFIVALEAELWRRVDAGLVQPPAGKYSRRDYWARHCGALGAMTTRQRHAITGAFCELCTALRHSQDWAYLDGIASHATNGALISWQHADSPQANAILHALNDRLHYARRQPVPSGSADATPEDIH